MIYVFEKTATDFSSNGLGALLPIECTTTETLNSTWELTMKHPLDADGKWRRLQRGNIIRAPVPAAMTPAIAVSPTPTEIKEIWRVSTSGGRLHLRSGTGTTYKILGKYKNGSQVVLLKKATSSWYEVAAPDGKRGYMASSYLRYVRTETTQGTAEREVVEARQLRDQPFRIYRIVPGLDGITVYARHIFYDLADNLVRSYNPKDVTGSAVAANILSMCEDEQPFSMLSDLDTTGSAEWTNANPVDMLLGDAGLIETWRGELARDWFDVYAVKRVGRDSGVTVRQGKNITGLTVDEDESDVATRIAPVGQDKDGKPLYLPEVYLDSPRISEYANIKWRTLDVSEAKEVTKGDDKMTKAQCYAKMREAAQAEFDVGCDLPDITITVEFVNLPDTVEGKELAALNHIFLGDTVHVFCERLGVAVAMRMTDCTYDCIGRMYTKMSLGTVTDGLEGVTITARQLGSTSIPGSKLMLGSVGTGQLRDLAVDTAKIQVAAIGTAHIQEAAITSALIHEAAITAAHIEDAAIDTAKIQDAAITGAKIGNAEIDTAKISDAAIDAAKIKDGAIINAKIGNAEIDTAKIKDAAIDAAKIKDAAIDAAKIKDGAITNAKIQDATIDTAKIALGAITTALIKTGAIGTAQIADGSITNAKVVDLNADVITAGTLSVERLLLKGANGLFYAINATDSGLTTEQLSQEEYQNRLSGTVLVAKSVTAEQIAAKSITANEIAAGTITANEIAAETIKGTNIEAGTLTTSHVAANFGETLDLSSNTGITLRVAEAVDESLYDINEQAAGMSTRIDQVASSVITSDKIAGIVYADEGYKTFVGETQTTARSVSDILTAQEEIDGKMTTVYSWHEFKDGVLTLGESKSDVVIEIKPGAEAGLYIKDNTLPLAQFAASLATMRRLSVSDSILFPNHVIKGMASGDLAIMVR